MMATQLRLEVLELLKKKINKEKKVRNPKNNEILFKKQTYKLHFKTGKTLHKKLNNISLKMTKKVIVALDNKNLSEIIA